MRFPGVKDGPKTYSVRVYNNHVLYRRGGKWSTDTRNRPLAYLTYQGEGACVHHVEATSGPEAKREAIRHHLAGIEMGRCSGEEITNRESK